MVRDSLSPLIFVRLFLLCLSILLHPSNLRAQNSNEIRIGVMAPTTGDYASAGEEIQRGITIAQDQLRLEGIQTKISFENACLPAQGVTALRKMLDKDKIEAIVSNYCVITLNAILPIIAKNSVITFQNSSVPEKLITSSPFTYATWPSIEQEVGAMIAAAGDESIKRPGLIYLESPWGSGYADAFRDALSNRGIKPLVDLSQGFDVHDFRSETTRLASTKSSMILAAHTGAVMASFLKQARVMNIQGSSIFVPSDNDDQAIVSSAGVAAEGVSLFSTESPKESPARSRYRSEYEKRYKRSPDPLSRHAYDQLILTARALSECKRDISCARTRIEATSNYDGASGQFSMTSKRTPLRPLYRKQVRDGAFRFVE